MAAMSIFGTTLVLIALLSGWLLLKEKHDFVMLIAATTLFAGLGRRLGLGES